MPDTELLAGTVSDVVIAAAIMVVGVVAVSVLVRLATSKPSTDSSTSSNRERLWRHTETTEIVHEHPDGYGLAVKDLPADGTVEVVYYNPQDEVFERVTVHEEQLGPLADVLSVRAELGIGPDAEVRQGTGVSGSC